MNVNIFNPSCLNKKEIKKVEGGVTFRKQI